MRNEIMNNSGKTLTILLIVVSILLVCLTGISVFFFLQEIELRETAEYNLKQMEVSEAKIQEDLKDAKKQAFLLEEKTKESNDRLQSLTKDLEMEQGLREQIKKENEDLKAALEKETKIREELQRQLDEDAASSGAKIGELQDQLSVSMKKTEELEAARQDLETQLEKYKQTSANPTANATTTAKGTGENIELEPIVISPEGAEGAKVISVDYETEFLIISLGKNQGAKVGMILSVYRDKDYLGDIKISRVLPEMSAADFVPPLTSQQVNKDDQVAVEK